MNTLIIVTLSITVFCNTVAGIGSYLVLNNKLDSHRIQQRSYRKNVWRKRYPLIAFNLGILYVLIVIGLLVAHPVFDMNWQSYGSIFAQIIFLIFIDDAYFYFFHRKLHTTPKLYDKIHKIHHRACAPFPLEYIYVHPLEWMGGGLGIPIGLGCILLSQGSISVHAFWIFAFWRNFHEVDIHSGLHSRFSKYIPFYGTTEHHDTHHKKNTHGNYASTFTVWDKLLGTEVPSQSNPSRSVG